ncbi:MAG: toll/interleukin-1 receptor domain-containing protein [Bacilli bacterium]|nr:toll/interleukin-1 receptor domain-containing protein [Bacilli bacterium]
MGGSINIYEGSKPFLFISYARTDEPLIRPLLEQLSLMHVRFWYDVASRPGSIEGWNAEIEAHMRKCGAVMVFATETSLSRPAVKRELNTAHLTLGKPIFPIFFKKSGYLSLLPDGLLWLDTMECRFLDQTSFAKIIRNDIPSKYKGLDAPSTSASTSTGSNIIAVPVRVDNFKMPEIIREFRSELKENIRCNRVHKAYVDSQEFLNNLFVLFVRLFEFKEPLRSKAKAYLDSDTFYAKGCEIVLKDILSDHRLYTYFASINEKANNVKHPDGSKHSAMDLREFCEHFNSLLTKFDLFLGQKLKRNINLFRPLTVNYKKTMEGAGTPINPAPTKPTPAKTSTKKPKNKPNIREWDIGLSLNEKNRTVPIKGILRTSMKVTLLLSVVNPNSYELKKAEITAIYGDSSAKRTYDVHNGENTLEFELSWSNKESLHRIVFEASVKYKTGFLRWPEKTAKTTTSF